MSCQRAREHWSPCPPAVAQSLARLGENLAIARLRRRESQRVWAKRLGISVPTLIRLERGDAGVGVGIYATALWLIGRAGALPELAAPEKIAARSRATSARLLGRRAVRAPHSAEARLGRKSGGRELSA